MASAGKLVCSPCVVAGTVMLPSLLAAKLGHYGQEKQGRTCSCSVRTGGRITAGVGANLIGQHASDRNQEATVYVGGLDPQARPFTRLLICTTLFPPTLLSSMPSAVSCLHKLTAVSLAEQRTSSFPIPV